MTFRRSVLALWIGLIALPVFSQSPPATRQWERLINKRIMPFDLSLNNQFKLAAYAEMKGRYFSDGDAISLHFGNLGSISFFENNCILRTDQNQVFHLDRQERGTLHANFMDEQIHQLFERIIMLGDHGADPRLIRFVDEHLARKNLEPFDKLFVRHMLIRYGRFADNGRQVTLHTDWLPYRSFSYRQPHDSTLVQRPTTPLSIRLGQRILRGFYLEAGGTVYVEDVDRPVSYATGEEYAPNVTAFKVFMQKLFIQSVQYVVRSEANRLEQLAFHNAYIPPQETAISQTHLLPKAVSQRSIAPPSAQAAPRETHQIDLAQSVSPLYHHENWIPMMLALLRARQVNIGDDDVIQHFIHQEHFPTIYEMLLEEEKEAVDQYIHRQGLPPVEEAPSNRLIAPEKETIVHGEK